MRGGGARSRQRPGPAFVVVAYDIGDDKRRARAAQVLLGFGARIQGSVYELWLDDRRLERLWASLVAVVKEGDIVRCYLICNACRPRTRSFGLPAPEDEVAFIV